MGHIQILQNGWKIKMAAVNPKYNDDKWFHYTLTVALSHEQIKKIFKGYQKLSLLLINIIGNT